MTVEGDDHHRFMANLIGAGAVGGIKGSMEVAMRRKIPECPPSAG